MGGEISTGWLLVAVAAGAVGAGIFVYGFRQKKALPLVFGAAVSACPMLVRSAWLSGLVCAALLALFIVLQRRV